MQNSDLSHFTIRDELLYRNHLLYVPVRACRTQVLQNCHDDHLVGHLGGCKNIRFDISGVLMALTLEIVKEFIKTCDICVHSKAAQHHPYGLLHPLPLPTRPWASLSVDFIADLPCIGDRDMVLVIVDRFSKMAHFVPCLKTTSGEETIDLFLNNVVRLHGLPEDVTSD